MAEDLKEDIQFGADTTGVEAGVNRVKRSLADLGGAAARAGQTSANGMNAAGEGGERASKRVETATRSMQASLQRLIAEQQAGSKSSREYWEALAAQRNVNVNALRPLLDQLDAYKGKAREAAQESGRLGDSFSGLGAAAALAGRAFALLGVVTSARELASMADASTNVASKLTLVTSSATELASIQQRLFTVAQASRVSFVDLVGTYAQVARSTKDLGISQNSLLGVIQTISQAVTISGGSAQSAQAALVQLSQGFASGALRGEELNSVLEQTPRLAQAIADGLGVSIGKLREMGAAGELTSSKVLTALEKSAASVQAEFGKMAVTVEQATTQASNSALRLVGVLDKIAGASGSAASGISRLSSGMDGLATDLERISATKSFSDFLFLAFNNQRTLNAELDVSQKELKRLEGQLARAPNNIYTRSAIAEMREYVAQIREAQSRFGQLTGQSVGGGGGRGSINPPTVADNNAAQKGVADEIAKYLSGDARQTKAEIRTEEIQKAIAANAKLVQSVAERYQGEARVNELLKLRAALETEVANINEKHRDKSVAGAKAEQTAYQSTVASIQAKIAENAQELTYSGRLTESDKLRIKLMSELDAGAKSLSASHKATAIALLEKLAAQEREKELIKQSVELYKQQADIQAELAADYVAQSRAREAGRQTVADYAKGILDANEALRYELSLMGLGEQAREVALEQYRIELELKRQIAAIDANSGFENEAQREAERARVRAAAAIAKANASSKVFLDNWKESVKQYDDIFRQGFADMLNNGQDGWKSFTRSLVTTFKTTVADQIYKMFAQPFVVNIVGNLMGLTGGGGAGGVAGAVAGGSSLLNTASNVGSAASFLSGNSLLSAVPGLGAIGGALSGFGTAITASIQSLVGITGTTSQMVASLAAAGHVAAPGVAAGVQAANLIPGWGWALAGVGALFGGDIISGLFGRKLKDQGIEGTFGGPSDFEGRTYQYYKGGLFRSNKTRYGELDEDLRSGLADQFGALQAGTSEMAKILGLGTSAIDDFTAGIKISFNGLDEAGIQEALKAEFQKIAESMASLTLGTTEFSRAGETSVEAITRLAGSLSAVNQVMDTLGLTLLNASLAGGSAASSLVDAFGGIESFVSAAGSFYENYYSEAERMETLSSQLSKTLAGFDLSIDPRLGDAAKEQFRAAATAALDAGDGKLAASLLAISGNFATAADYFEQLSQSAAEAAKKAAEDARKQLIDSTYSLFQRALSRDRDALSEQASAISDVIGAISSSVDMLTSNARELYGTVDSTAQMLAAQGMVYIEQALAGVRGGASLTGYDGLTDAISAARGGISGGNYATEFDRQRDTLVLAGQLSELGELGDLQLSVGERQLKGINAQLDALDALGKRADALVNGTKELTDTVDGYFAQLLAILAPEKTPGTGGGGGSSGGPDYGPTWSNNGPGKSKYSRPVSYSGGVIYQDVSQEDEKRLDQYASGYHAFDGTGDAAGLNNWIKDNNLKPSDLSALSGLYGSDWEAWFKANGMSFAVGTNYVPHDMVAQIHKGERIIPEADNRALIAAVNGGGQGDSGALLAELKALREDNRVLGGEVVRLQNRLAKVIERWDGDGVPPARDEKAMA